MPLTGRLFAGFEDKGWMFSKVLAITVTGFLTWPACDGKDSAVYCADMYWRVSGVCCWMWYFIPFSGEEGN